MRPAGAGLLSTPSHGLVVDVDEDVEFDLEAVTLDGRHADLLGRMLPVSSHQDVGLLAVHGGDACVLDGRPFGLCGR